MSSQSHSFPEPIKALKKFSGKIAITRDQLILYKERVRNIFSLMQDKIQQFEQEISKCCFELDSISNSYTNIVNVEARLTEIATRLKELCNLKIRYEEKFVWFTRNKSRMFWFTDKWNENYDQEEYLEYLLLCSDITK